MTTPGSHQGRPASTHQAGSSEGLADAAERLRRDGAHGALLLGRENLGKAGRPKDRIAISSPYARRGVLWEAYDRHYGQASDPVLVWRADTARMDPGVDAAIVAAAYEADEAAASAEYGAEFRRDIEAFLAHEVVDACTVHDRHELPPLGPPVRYVAFTDPSGGSSDAWTLALGHGERIDKEWIAVLDVIRETKRPFSPDAVVADFAALLKRYRVTSVVGDRYGGEFPRELFAKHGIHYEPSERVKSEIYLEVLPMLNAHRVRLLDLPRLVAQLLALERKTNRGGRDSVDHAPARTTTSPMPRAARSSSPARDPGRARRRARGANRGLRHAVPIEFARTNAARVHVTFSMPTVRTRQGQPSSPG